MKILFRISITLLIFLFAEKLKAQTAHQPVSINAPVPVTSAASSDTLNLKSNQAVQATQIAVPSPAKNNSDSEPVIIHQAEPLNGISEKPKKN
jgi:hypothetical protein